MDDLAMLDSIWQILANTPATIAEHNKRAAAIEHLKKRLELLKQLEAEAIPAQDQ